MFPRRSRLLAFAFAALCAVVGAGAADAGWVTIKNDTNKAVTVQEVVVVNGKQVRGKPTKLLAGESFREFQNTPGIKSYEVLDAGAQPMTLWNGNLNCKAATQSFSISTVNGKLGVFCSPEPKKP
ncbi:hypothetical protein [Frigoriglobus tundricola]|uniref:Uncharacterized protein n=1 Tax=Frigoriglobus tundricola TaxID=2774151 RepID=A0A6M5Z4C4_9BACT|nr:hypothetical protein [Frigoriglobus tundricola]QJX00314.1 hypothetical protein FTUN_7940 [Frigoriglobus tundricola]